MAIMKGYGVIEPTVSWGWMEKEIPEPGPFEALCSPVAVLPCTSDVHSAHFRNAWPNRILGHEGVGRVEKVGAMVTDIKVGDIVAIPAVTPIWRGRQIAEGLHEHTGGFLGGRYLSSKLDGTFGEYFIIPDADMNLAVVPKGVSIKAAGLVGDMVTT
ncbi:MAG: alcohol dehydrogenase catalytic domain-containing protein, partial [Oscillospiraceae bacterium]